MQVRRNIMFAKAGGTAGKNSKNYKISLPADMVRELGVTEEDRSVTLTCEDGKIVIEKDKKFILKTQKPLTIGVQYDIL